MSSNVKVNYFHSNCWCDCIHCLYCKKRKKNYERESSFIVPFDFIFSFSSMLLALVSHHLNVMMISRKSLLLSYNNFFFHSILLIFVRKKTAISVSLTFSHCNASIWLKSIIGFQCLILSTHILNPKETKNFFSSFCIFFLAHFLFSHIT